MLACSLMMIPASLSPSSTQQHTVSLSSAVFLHAFPPHSRMQVALMSKAPAVTSIYPNKDTTSVKATVPQLTVESREEGILRKTNQVGGQHSRWLASCGILAGPAGHCSPQRQTLLQQHALRSVLLIASVWLLPGTLLCGTAGCKAICI